MSLSRSAEHVEGENVAGGKRKLTGTLPYLGVLCQQRIELYFVFGREFGDLLLGLFLLCKEIIALTLPYGPFFHLDEIPGGESISSVAAGRAIVRGLEEDAGGRKWTDCSFRSSILAFERFSMPNVISSCLASFSSAFLICLSSCYLISRPHHLLLECIGKHSHPT